MASKGVVQMEDLKNQLGDHIPGVVNITARALGVSTKELYDMSAAGELLAEDVIPALVKELHNLYAAAANTAALESGQSAMNKLGEAWTELKGSFADNETVANSIHMITAALRVMSAVLQVIRKQPGAGQFYGEWMQFDDPMIWAAEASLGRQAKLKAKIADIERDIAKVSGNSSMLKDVQSGALKQLNEDLTNYRIELQKVDGTISATSAKERQYVGDLKNRIIVTEKVVKVTDKQRKSFEEYIATPYDKAKQERDEALKGAKSQEDRFKVEAVYKEKVAKLDDQKAKAADQAAKAGEKEAKAFNDALNSLLPLRKEQEQYAKDVALLDKALAAGTITQEQYNEGLSTAEHKMQSYKEKIKDAKEEVKKLAELLKNADQWKTDINQALMSDAERQIDQLTRQNALWQEQIDKIVQLDSSQQEWADNAKRGLDEKLIERIHQINDEASQMGELFEKVADDIQDAFSDMFLDMLNGTDNAMDAISNMFKKLLAELATMAIARPIIVPIVASMGGAMGLSQGTIAKALGMDTAQLNSMGGGGSLFSMGGGGWTGMQVDLATMLDNNFGMTGTAEFISGLNSNVFGAATAGLGSLAMPLLSGQGLTAKTGLQAGGAALGSLLGPGGAVLGGLLGNLAGGMFDNGPDTFHFLSASDAYGGNYLRGKGMDIRDYEFTGGDDDSKIFKAYGDQIRSIQSAFNSTIESLAAALPTEIANSMMSGLESANLRQILIDASQGKFETAKAEEAIKQVATTYSKELMNALGNSYADAIAAYVGQNGISKLVGGEGTWNMLTAEAQANIEQLFGGAVSQIKGGQAESGIQTIQGIMQSISQIEQAFAPIAEIIATDGMTEYGRQIRAINIQFDQYAEQLRAAGVDLSKYTDLEKARNIALREAAVAMGGFTHVLEDLANEAEDALSVAEDNLRKAFGAEQDRLAAQHEAVLAGLNDQLNVAQESVSKLTALTGSLRSALNGMRLESDAFARDRRTGAQATLQATLAAARRGELDPSVDLGNTLSVLSESSTGLFANFEDYQRDFWQTYLAVAELEQLSGDQLSEAERTVDLLQRQIEAENTWFKTETDLLTQQLNAILGLNTAIMSIAQATGQYQAAQAAAAAAKAQAAAGAGGTGISEASYFAEKVAQLTAAGIMGTVYDGVMLNTVADVKQVFANQGFTAQSHWEQFGRYEGLDRPSFASGTDYVPSDMVANIHQGERIVPAAYNRSDATNAQLVEAINSLRAELRAQNGEIAKNTSKTAKLLDAWDGDGMPAERELV